MRQVLTRIGIMCVVVVCIITFFNSSPSIILAEEINMERPVTELKVGELIEILRQPRGAPWSLNKESYYTVIYGLSSPQQYRICNDRESGGYIRIDVGGTHRPWNQIDPGNCRDFEAREYLKIERESFKNVKGTYRKLD